MYADVTHLEILLADCTLRCCLRGIQKTCALYSAPGASITRFLSSVTSSSSSFSVPDMSLCGSKQGNMKPDVLRDWKLLLVSGHNFSIPYHVKQKRCIRCLRANPGSERRPQLVEGYNHGSRCMCSWERNEYGVVACHFLFQHASPQYSPPLLNFILNHQEEDLGASNESSSLLRLGTQKPQAERQVKLIRAALYAVQVFYSFFIM